MNKTVISITASHSWHKLTVATNEKRSWPFVSRNECPQRIHKCTDLLFWVGAAQHNDRPTNQQREQDVRVDCKLRDKLKKTKTCSNSHLPAAFNILTELKSRSSYCYNCIIETICLTLVTPENSGTGSNTIQWLENFRTFSWWISRTSRPFLKH